MTLTCLLSTLFLAIGQAEGNPGNDPPADAGITYLDTSFEAEESLERARLLESDGRWADAAKLLQLTGQKFGRHVVMRSPGTFVSIREQVNLRIADWPHEGLDAYRAAFESTAAARLNAARDSREPRDFLLLADEYFATHAGAESLDLAAQLLIERGEFLQAHDAYRQLIDHHPDRARRAHWRAKSALAAAMAGNVSELESESKIPSRSEPPVDVAWMGRVQDLRGFLRGRLDELRQRTAELQAAETVTSSPFELGGANHRRGAYPASSVPEARLWKFDIPGAFTGGSQDESDYLDDPSLAESLARALQSGKLLNNIPVVGDGRIYFHDDRRVWAIDLSNPGIAAWTYGADESLGAAIWLHEDTVAPIYTSLYADGRLYVNLRNDGEKPDTEVEQSPHGESVICLDAKSGKVIWKNDLAEFHSQFEEAEVDGPPMLHNGELFVVGRRRKSFGFEACYLMRMRAEDGRIASMIHVAEAATGSYGYRRATVSIPAAAGDLVFVQTNLGAIAAVSSSLDRVAWIHTYDVASDSSGDQLWPERGGRPIRSWNYQPVMVWRDAIVCMPLDSTDVFVLDQHDGTLRERITGDTLQIPQTLLGILDDRLYAVGNEVICYDLAQHNAVWQRPIAVGQLLGRGCITASDVLIPTDRALLTYPLDGGPSVILPWRLEETANIVPLGDQLLAAAPGMIYGLANREEAFARLTRRASENPNDPMPSMALAELAFRSGQITRGIDAVQDAIQRVGGFARLTDNVARQKLFDQLVQFAAALDTASSTSPEPPNSDEAHSNDKESMNAAITLLKMAGQCAPTPEDHVKQRFRLAEAYTRVSRYTDAVETYHRVLADPTLRRLTVRITAPQFAPQPGDSQSAEAAEMRLFTASDSLVAGNAAANAIGDLIREHGVKVYAAIEEKASNRLKIAEADANAAAILEVAEAFPNSSVSTAAFAAHAQLLCQQGSLDAASQSFRRALSQKDCPSRAAVIRNYISCLSQDGRLEDAAEWLDRAERDYPRLQFSFEDRKMTFAELGNKLLGKHRFPLSLLPTTTGDNKGKFTRLYQDKAVVLDPVFNTLPNTSWDALLVSAAGQVDARNPVTGRGLWPKPFSSKSQPTLLGMDSSRFILSTPWRIVAVTRTSGQISWEFGKDPADDPMLEPESTSPWTQQALVAERAYCASDRGEIVCVELSDGVLRWSHRADSSLAGPIAVDEKYFCFPTWQGSELVINVHDALTGKLQRKLSPTDAWPMQSMRLTRKHRLLLIRTTSIQSFDIETGKQDWFIPAPDHFALATLQTDSDSLYISPDGRRVHRYDLDDGRLVWRTHGIGKASEHGIWVGLSRGAMFVAGPDRIEAFDCADGRNLWSASSQGCLAVQSPSITQDSIVTISIEPPRRNADDGANEIDKDRREYVIRRHSLESGATLSVKDGGPLVSEPITSFGGMHLRDKSIILLDGSSLIGYVDDKPE